MMRLRRFASLVGALGALFVFSSSAEASLLNKFSDWLDSMNKKKDFSRQHRFYSVENCIKYYERGNFKEAYFYCRSAAEINRNTLYYAAALEYRLGSKDLAFNLLKATERFLLEKLEAGKGDERERIRDKRRLANVYLWLGETYNELQAQEVQKTLRVDHDKLQEYRKKTVEYLKKAMDLGEEVDKKIVVAKAGMNLGSYYLEFVWFNYNLINNAAEVLEKALKAIEEVKPGEIKEEAKETPEFSKKEFQEIKGRIYNLWGVVHYWKKDYKTAEEYYLKALEIGEKINSVQTQAYKYNLAVIYKEMGDYDRYEEYLKGAIEDGWKRKKGDIEKMARWSRELGEFYLKHKNDKKRAKEWFISAIELYDQLIRSTSNEFKREDYRSKRRALYEEIRKIDSELY